MKFSTTTILLAGVFSFQPLSALAASRTLSQVIATGTADVFGIGGTDGVSVLWNAIGTADDDSATTYRGDVVFVNTDEPGTTASVTVPYGGECL